MYDWASGNSSTESNIQSKDNKGSGEKMEQDWDIWFRFLGYNESSDPQIISPIRI